VVSVAENLLIFGANVSNAFAEVPPPKQGFYIRPDKAFHDWWANHNKHHPIPPGAVIPILLAMQGHPESPCLWKKHADQILCKLGMHPTTHGPCLYLGIIADHRVLFLCHVDDFAIVCEHKSMANILLNMLHKKLTIPLKQMGLLDMYNGLDVLPTKDLRSLAPRILNASPQSTLPLE
jgi:hypothetical protein